MPWVLGLRRFACGECTVEGLWKEWNMNERSGSDQVADVEQTSQLVPQQLCRSSPLGMSLWHGPLHRMGSAVSAPFDR